MKNKKSEKANLENKKGILFLIGLIVSLSVMLLAFEWKSQPKSVMNLGSTSFVAEEFVFIPQTKEEVKEIQPKKIEMPFFELISDDSEIKEDFDFFETEAGAETSINFKDLIFTSFEKKEEEKEEVFLFPQVMPEFPGGEVALLKYLSSSVKYPVIAQENGIQGKVYVSFIIDENGQICDAKVLRGVDISLNDEALRVVCKMPKWKPGKQAGKAVKVRYNVPINFQLR